MQSRNKYSTSKLGLGVFILILFTTCIKGPRCWGENKNKGIIKSEVTDIPFPSDIIGSSIGAKYIISSEIEFKKLFDSIDYSKLPTIDFNSFTLLGKYETGGCYTKVIREVTDIPKEKKYLYKIKIRNCGACKRGSVLFNFVLVPKLPSDYTVTFEVD